MTKAAGVHFRYKTPVFLTIGSTKFFVQCFHYSISIQIIICDILYRLSLPLFFETFVMGHQEKSAHKNANSSRRQTNYIQIGYSNTLSCTEFAFYQIHHKRAFSKKGISIPKENTPIH